MADLNRIVSVKVGTPAQKPYPYLFEKQVEVLPLGGDIEPGRLQFLPRDLVNGSYTGMISSAAISAAGGVILDITRQDEWLNTIEVPPTQTEANDTTDLRFYVFNRSGAIGLTFVVNADPDTVPYIQRPDQLALQFTSSTLTGAAFDVGETVLVGFNSRQYAGVNLETHSAWAKLQEFESAIATIGIDLPESTTDNPTEISESALITLRYNPLWFRARGVVDDQQREWVVSARRASDDRRYYELQCTRRHII